MEKLAIDSVRLELLEPKMTYRKTIYIFGIPQFFSDYSVKTWLEGHSMAVVSDFRKLLHKDTPFWNTGRSVVVEVSKKKDIPGFLPLESNTRSARKIAIWYPGIGPWCRYCLSKGHRVHSCPQKPVIVAREFPEMESWRRENWKLLCDEYKDEIHYFFTKESLFSNHHNCSLTIEDTVYSSTEQYLFAQKARHCADKSAEEEILNLTDAKLIKARGEKIDFPGTKMEWHVWAEKELQKAVEAKFGQNAELRKALFNTAGKRLVEASTNPFWGCGFS